MDALSRHTWKIGVPLEDIICVGIPARNGITVSEHDITLIVWGRWIPIAFVCIISSSNGIVFNCWSRKRSIWSWTRRRCILPRRVVLQRVIRSLMFSDFSCRIPVSKGPVDCWVRSSWADTSSPRLPRMISPRLTKTLTGRIVKQC